MLTQQTTLSIANWPIFQQISEIFALIMRLVYDIGELINIRHAIFYIVFFCILSKIILLPIDLVNLRNRKISRWVTADNTNNAKRYSKSSIVPYKPKIELEKFIVAKKYSYSSSIGLKMLFTQLPLLVIIYSIVGNLTKYIPALSKLSESEITSLYMLWGNDIRNKPILPGFKITPFIIFPILAALVPVISTAIQNKLNGRKNDFSILTSNILTLIIAFRFSTYLSIYWITQSVFSLIVSVAYILITKNKQKEYYINQGLHKLNKSRVKRGMEPLEVPIDIPKLEVVKANGEQD